MASSVIKGSSVKSIVTRGFAAQAATAAKQQSYTLPDHQPQVTKLPSGSIVVSQENNSPVSQVAVFVRGGSRDEAVGSSGVSHFARLCAGLGTQNMSHFGITRRTQQFGGSIICENGREHTGYVLTCLRDHVTQGFEILSEVALHQAFKPWELEKVNTRLLTELAGRPPSAITADLLHAAAFRSTGLGHSIFVPEHRIGKITSDQLHEFIHSTHTGPRIAFVGLGVPHADLTKLAHGATTQSGHGVSSPSAYKGGELRHENGSPFACVALASSGAKLGTEEALALNIAQFALGAGAGIKYGSNASSKLAALVAEAGGHGSAAPINAQYLDEGLFGFLVHEDAAVVGNVVRTIAKGMKNLKLTDADVKAAKAKAKSAILMATESTAAQVEEMGLQAVLTGEYKSPADAAAAIDSVSSASVQSALANAVKGKPSMAAIGGLHNVPYLDEL